MSCEQYFCKQKDLLDIWSLVTLEPADNDEVKVKNYHLPTKCHDSFKHPILQPSDLAEVFVCSICQKEDKQICGEHQYILLKDSESQNFKSVSRLQTLPWPLLKKEKRDGIFTEANLPRRLIFGPYAGEFIPHAKQDDESLVGWRIHNGRFPDLCIDGSNEKHGNWLSYVQCAKSSSVANLEVFQYMGCIYYATIQCIPKDSELLVWYGDEYAEFFNFNTSLVQDNPINDTDDSTMFDILYRFICSNSQLPPVKMNEERVFSANDCKKSHRDLHIVCSHSRCNLCWEIFFYYSDYEEHFELRDNLGCELCNQQSSTMCEWVRHRIVHEIKYKCKKCVKSKKPLPLNGSLLDAVCCFQCGNIPSIKRRSRILRSCFKSSRTIFACLTPSCRRNFNSEADRTKHMLLCKQKQIYKCNNCSSTFADKDGITLHLKAEKCKKMRFLCKQCDIAFDYREDFDDHVKSNHVDEKDKIKPYPCTACDKSFDEPSLLKKHLSVHKMGPSSKCPMCSKTFYRKDNLNRHLSTHSFYRKFQCDFCEKRFRRKFTLQNHINSHLSLKTRICHFCNCTFAQTSGLSKHLVKHNPDKPFRCRHCRIEFVERGDWQVHLRITHGDIT